MQNENSNNVDKNIKKLALFLGLVLAGALSSGQAPHVPEGTAAGGGRVIDCRDRNTLLYGLSDTVRYVAYVRGYCTECSKWGEWSEGIVVYVGEREGVERAQDV